MIVVVAGLMVMLVLRARTRDAAFGQDAEPLGMFWLRNALLAAGLIFVGYKLSLFRGLPNVVTVLSVLTLLLCVLYRTDDAGPPHPCAWRQRKSRAPVRDQARPAGVP